MEKYIYIVPIGNIEKDLLDFLKKKIEEVFNIKVKDYKNLSIPEEAYNPQRKQYYSYHFLNLLSSLNPLDAYKILGITNVDLYTDYLNFIFGEAIVNGKECVISIARLDNKFYNLPADNELLKLRTLKEAVHELGHTMGLKHCETPSCVMYFSNTLADTDKKSYNFCPKCKSRLSNFF
ncbi:MULTISPECIES: archaemetzincin family Zn-dependent metalloprotease [Dictyoglomus]|jgi:archaemetzincin|uniref:Peptidase zinc-dependent n=1 Tax=Dictyoglomus turgidum (strain DSM 6724 / Z-1310) TaxID=515635 RepID=B8E0Q3_DICTD|nr:MULTISPECIES: archaemetzincin family Zn-dependent metalloprotease [Dictyoglomus]ACK43073.1 peptidase zinc-dependent [Dictyoglomus turgidum DSM 6724]PNV78659.1 MAG: hypothetical protein C0196_08560 [Dictyoglomus turgidum]HBU31121.1 hypothetical protein [Dictyoglomus sp.]